MIRRWKIRMIHSPSLARTPSICAGPDGHFAAQRSRLINKQHLAQLVELDLVEMQEDVPYLTTAGQDTVWKD